MALSSEVVLNALPGSVQFRASDFTIRVIGTTPHPDNDFAVYYGTAGDLTGDGNPEVVIGGWSYRGFDATGTPPPVKLTIVSTGPTGARLLDVQQLLGTTTTPGSAAIRIADFTGDGRNDLLLAGHNESPFTDTATTLYVNNGSSFTAHTSSVLTTTHNGEVGDLNGDGLTDFVGAAYTSASGAFDPRLYRNGSYQILDNHQVDVVWLSNGDGSFTTLPFANNKSLAALAAQPYPSINWGQASDLTIADLDGDGNAEIIAVDQLISIGTSPIVGDSWIFTNIQWDATSAWGDPVALPKPYFENNSTFNDIPSDISNQRSHDVQVTPLDFNNDGSLDLVISSTIFHQNGRAASILQFLRNDGNLHFTDVTNTTFYNAYLGKSDPGHDNVFLDVNGDGFLDIIATGQGQYVGEGQLLNSWVNEVFINTGNGKFVSQMWGQFHELTQQLNAAGQAANLGLFVPGNDGAFYPYLTADGRLGFVAPNSGYNGSPGYTSVYFDVQANNRLYTGPNGDNPALQGAAGFNEAYYLTEHPDVAAAVTAGTWASGLAHYLGVGRGLGYAAFAANAHVAGSAGADTIVLREGAEAATGEAGDDIIQGLAGNDTLDGGSGRDLLYGGTGNDTYLVDRLDDLVFEGAGAGSDTVIATGNYYLYANIETLTLAAGAGDIFGVGNDLANTITGNAGGNVLLGGGGADTIAAGDGVDIVYGEAGADRLSGEAGNDVLVGGEGGDIIDGGTGGDLIYGEAGNDSLIGGSDFVFDQLVAGAGDDTLRGDSGFGDFDYLFGETGNDSFYVDTPYDLVFEQAREGIDTVYADINGTGYYLYENIENLVLLGATSFGVGNGLDNRLTGSAAGNYLLGGAGNDTLDGGGGGDVLFGEAGADVFAFTIGTGGDVIGDFAAGSDRISLTGFGIASFAALQSRLVEVGGTTAINLGNGDFIVINGVANAALAAGDFIFG